MNNTAILLLEDGTVFKGQSIGYQGQSVGEVVFNTAMTGYQEILSDPSYARQIITLTYPHIGNVGTTHEDDEADQVFAAGLIIRDLPVQASNWRMQQTLTEYLQARQVVAIADIDTRKLTRILRDKGAQRGCLAVLDDSRSEEEQIADFKSAINTFSGLKGLDLAQEVTTDQQYAWGEGSWQLAESPKSLNRDSADYHVVAYDFGIKKNILRMLVDRGCYVTVIPAKTPVEEALAMHPDGIFLSNGPGDPEPCDYAIDAIQTLLEKKIPVFGICLGHQLLGLASGAKTTKMKFGHHGANHPVQNLENKQVFITSQNHGFAVDEASLPSTLQATHRSLFDGSLQGIVHSEAPAYSFQGHPEASPGPHDIAPIFDAFIDIMEADKNQIKNNQAGNE